MKEMLVLLSAVSALPQIIRAVENHGGRVLQRYGQNVILVEANEDLENLLQQDVADVKTFSGSVPEGEIPADDLSARMGIAAWNERHDVQFIRKKANRPGVGVSWGEAGFEREGETGS